VDFCQSDPGIDVLAALLAAAWLFSSWIWRRPGVVFHLSLLLLSVRHWSHHSPD
jgi:hypothetical protein